MRVKKGPEGRRRARGRRRRVEGVGENAASRKAGRRARARCVRAGWPGVAAKGRVRRGRSGPGKIKRDGKRSWGWGGGEGTGASEIRRRGGLAGWGLG